MTPAQVYDLKEEDKILGIEDTFTARIFVGCLDTEKTENGPGTFERPLAEVKAACQEFVQERGLCVNVQKTFFQYGSDGDGGNENGAVVELIQYPRFPKTEMAITNLALELAEILMERMNQKRVSIVTSDETYTLKNPEHPEVD
jgi:hypothetical protein